MSYFGFTLLSVVFPFILRFMHINPPDFFCDWVVIHQEHRDRHTPVNEGSLDTKDSAGNVIKSVLRRKSIHGLHGSHVAVSSDGFTVRLMGNVGKFDRPENLFGPDLDQVKILANDICQANNLPPFDGGTTSRHPDGTEIYTGASFQRIDMTTNLQTGTVSNRLAVLQHIQSLTMPRLGKSTKGLNTYFGEDSKSRKICIYDKALQIRETLLPKSDDSDHLNRVAQYCDDTGLIRYETRYGKFLRHNDLRKWDNVNHAALAAKTCEDLVLMPNKIEKYDVEAIPNAVLGTLCMYMNGYSPRKRLSENTYYRHRKILLEHGFDISNENVEAIKPPIRVIEIKPAAIPDWYPTPWKEAL